LLALFLSRKSPNHNLLKVNAYLLNLFLKKLIQICKLNNKLLLLLENSKIKDFQIKVNRNKSYLMTANLNKRVLMIVLFEQPKAKRLTAKLKYWKNEEVNLS